MKTCVVRVQTSSYVRGDCYVQSKTVRVMKSLTKYDYLSEETSSVGVKECLDNILNLNEVQDGLYYLVPTNISLDLETGYIDDWNFKLTEYSKPA